MIKSVRPSLIILIFHDDQFGIDQVCSHSYIPQIPILCLTRWFGHEFLTWDKEMPVFTQPLEYALKGYHLTGWIRSLFIFRGIHNGIQQPQTLAEQAIQSTMSPNQPNLARYVLELDQKRRALLKIKERILQLYPLASGEVKEDLISIATSIKNTLEQKRYWDDFKVLFQNVSPEFLDRLGSMYPMLTQTDLKYCCYLMLNLSNDDICHLLGISSESVRTHKYRLKKKMQLSKEQHLGNYIRALANSAG